MNTALGLHRCESGPSFSSQNTQIHSKIVDFPLWLIKKKPDSLSEWWPNQDVIEATLAVLRWHHVKWFTRTVGWHLLITPIIFESDIYHHWKLTLWINSDTNLLLKYLPAHDGKCDLKHQIVTARSLQSMCFVPIIHKMQHKLWLYCLFFKVPCNGAIPTGPHTTCWRLSVPTQP